MGLSRSGIMSPRRLSPSMVAGVVVVAASASVWSSVASARTAREAVDIRTPAHGARIQASSVQVKVLFSGRIAPRTLKASLNGHDVTRRFVIAKGQARAVLTVDDGLRGSSQPPGAVNEIRVSIRMLQRDRRGRLRSGPRTRDSLRFRAVLPRGIPDPGSGGGTSVIPGSA